MRAGWSTLVTGFVGVGVVFAFSCSSSPGSGGNPGKGGASGTTGVAGTSGDAGESGTTGEADTSGEAGTSDLSGIAGTTGTGGGTGGKGGTGGSACVPNSQWGVYRTPCGPAPTCEGNSIASLAYCDETTCSGPTVIWQRTSCGAMTCGGGKCLTHAAPPAKTCSIATDCGLPPTVCIGATEQLIFSDPTCDDGQCHWQQIVDTCGGFGISFLCRDGTCYDPGMLTRGPVTPTPSPDAMQPPPAPAHACSATADCPQPPSSCFRDSVVSYVHGVCRAGACSWEIDLNQCAGTCGNGVCVGS